MRRLPTILSTSGTPRDFLACCCTNCAFLNGLNSRTSGSTLTNLCRTSGSSGQTGGRLDTDEVESKWFGYAVGKWTDDYTFEIDTVGVNPASWLDNAGRPHSDEMKVHEAWHRLDYDTMELTVTVDDPKYYSAKWNGLDKFIVHRLPDTFDMEEFIYSQSETGEYNDSLAAPAVIGIGK